jgi:tetratricopeptide (TPR) repeat protein
MAGLRAGLLVAALCLAAGGWAADGDTYETWARHRDAVAKDPSVIRYYTFEGLLDSASKIPSLAGNDAPLSYGAFQEGGAAFEQLKVVEGRYPRKQAVRLDRGFFTAPPFEVANKTLTVEAWLRTGGYGAIRGLPVTYGGTLLSLGGGYWEGWRLTIIYPERNIGFEIGRPKPGSSAGFWARGWTDGAWHHLAATWDGKRMRTYVDGFLLGSMDYGGEFTPPSPAQFAVGYADSGFGSAILDVDEIAVYRRAFTAAEVLRSANYFAPISDELLARFAKANERVEAGDLAAAAAEYAGIAGAAGDAPVAAVARLRLGRVLRQQRSYAAASAEFMKVLDTPGLSERLKSMTREQLVTLFLEAPGDSLPRGVNEFILAMKQMTPREEMDARLNLARAGRRERRFGEAREQYAKVLTMAELSPRDRRNVRLELGHTCVEAGDFSRARAEYEKVAADGDAPPQYQSYARLLVARTYTRERAWAAAKREYEKLAAKESAPAVHREEARQRLRELPRVQAGLPARDPAWSRVQLAPKPAPAVKLHVAAKGSDNNAGTLDRPFATLERARQAIRDLRKGGELPAGGVAVYVRAGEYRRTETFKLGAEDSGTEKAPVTYRAYESESVRLSGGVKLTGFKAVDEPAVLARLPEEARGKVVQVDLRAQGITDLGQMRPYGYGFGPAPVTELFFDGKAMQPARWPNEGFLRTGKVTAAEGDRGPTVEYEGDRPSRWKQAADIRAFGYWVWDWAADTIGVASVDAQAHRVTMAQSPAYGIQPGHRYYFLNILEELDAPGEWYLDRANAILYLYPPTDPARADVRLSMLEAPMVQMDNVSNVTLQGLTLETSRGDGVIVNGGDHCLIAGCTIRQIAGTAVTISGGTGHGVLGCDLYTLGRGGTRIAGGDRKTLAPGGHFVENCDIHDFSRLVRTYAPAVHMDGCGNRIAHNLMYDSPGHAMRIEGNDHVIELNEIHDVVYESDDQGGLDIWFNPAYRGLIMRYNYWHHIGSGLTGCGQAGIRLDDAISGVHVYGNIFYRCSSALFGGIQIHGGKENVVENNIFVACKAAISLSEWGEERWKQFCASPEVVKATTVDVDISKPPYSTRYPELAHLTENHGHNYIWRNLAYDCGEFLMRDPGVLDVMDNLVTGQDPGFVDAAHGNFGLSKASTVCDRFGFEPVPFDEIGLYKDRLRASWPAANKAGERYVPGS